MDPVTSMVISLAPMLTESALQAMWELLKSRLTEAKEGYESKSREELSSPLESNRRMRLDELSELQTRAILEVLDTKLLQKVLTVSLELTAQAYEASVEQELDAIKRRTEQLSSFLDREEKERKYRNRVRVVAVLLSVASFVGLFALAILGPRFGLEASYVIPVLQIPLSVLLWSAIGSFTSLLYRFNKASALELQDPLRWLITRPLTGIVMGTVVYLVVRTGFLSAGAEELLTAETNELIWLVAFLVGFSDRFSEGLLKSLVGRLGGDKDADLVMSVSSPPKLSLAEILHPLSKIKERIIGVVSESAESVSDQESLEDLTEEPRSDEETPEMKYADHPAVQPALAPDQANHGSDSK